MDTAFLTAIISGLALMLALLAAITRGLWKLGRDISELETSLRNDTTSLGTALRKDITQARSEVELRIDTLSLRMGESISSIREHVNREVGALRKELTDDQKFGLRTFTQREDSNKDHENVRTELRLLDTQMSARFDRLEAKIDRRNHVDGDKKPGTI